jgi:hypothetical protein
MGHCLGRSDTKGDPSLPAITILLGQDRPGVGA